MDVGLCFQPGTEAAGLEEVMKIRKFLFVPCIILGLIGTVASQFAGGMNPSGSLRSWWTVSVALGLCPFLFFVYQGLWKESTTDRVLAALKGALALLSTGVAGCLIAYVIKMFC